MKSRSDVLSHAVTECLQELYSLAQPYVTWEDFIKENQEYKKKEEDWKEFAREVPIKEFCGPAPYEFYYIPREVMKEICDSYVHAYKLDSKQNLLDIIETLKSYCKEPVVDKYINEHTDEHGNHHPGHRGYAYPDNLKKEINKILIGIDETNICFEDMAEEIQEKFFEFLDMAGNFFNWNVELNSFNMRVYLGPSPNSNKEVVIDNWKKYRNKEIEINENNENDE